MTREDIIRMAREAGITINPPSWWEYTEHYHFAGFEQPFERFAALVAAAEREAIMKICNRHTEPIAGVIHHAIRARGNT